MVREIFQRQKNEKGSSPTKACELAVGFKRAATIASREQGQSPKPKENIGSVKQGQSLVLSPF